ncbi:hypothetical protein Y026_3081 [Burkholderia pseudomallei TSV28]|nr:hypothetical protein Y026_3081 [Burkholderia pseudomallei TSV28]
MPKGWSSHNRKFMKISSFFVETSISHVPSKISLLR